MKGEQEMKGIKKLFFQNLANAITLFGLLLAIWVLVLTINYPEQLWFILLLGGAVALTDLIDGWIARYLKITSDFGRILDQLRDRIFIYPALIVLTWHYRWVLKNQDVIVLTLTKALVIGILIVEILLFIAWCIAMSWFIKKTAKIDLSPNKWGRKKMFSGFVVVLIWLFSLTVEKYLGFPLINFSIFVIDLGLVLMIYWAYKSLEDYCQRAKF